ncbi:MAG: hypothetical protein HC841_02795 [Verrucomicrobiae bacterium]|nr:hypothetical protein [Verrucomicrobiae bacterium]
MPWPTENTLLATIAHEDRRRLERHLEPVLLPIRKKLEVAKKPIEYVYFPESGIASVVSHVNNDRQIEVGVIGREGMTGLAALCYHHGPVQNEVYMQVAGTGFQLSVAHLKEAFAASRSIHEIMLGFALFILSAGLGDRAREWALLN